MMTILKNLLNIKVAKDFIIGGGSSVGYMEGLDMASLSPDPTTDTIIKCVVAIVTGVITRLLTRLLERKKKNKDKS